MKEVQSSAEKHNKAPEIRKFKIPYAELLTLFCGESGDTGSSAASAMLLMAMTDRMLNSKYFRVRM